MVSIRDEIVLEESDTVINVAIQASLDPRGGFLVTDSREAQIRVYDIKGRLLHYVGRKGGGPSEFSMPAAAQRLSTGELLVVDRTLKAVLFSEDGQHVIRTYRLPFATVFDADLVDDSTLLVSGTLHQSDSLRAHLWRFNSDEVLASFFAVPIADGMRPVDGSAGFGMAAIHGDTVALTYALSDTVYLFTTTGTPIRKMPLGSPHFRHATPFPADVRSNPAALTAWLQSFDLVSFPAWTGDGGLAVEYMTSDSTRALVRRLVRLARDGTMISETLESPDLLTSNPAKGLLYFVHPEAETPNRWAVVRWR